MAQILAEIEEEMNGYEILELSQLAWDNYGIDEYDYDSKSELIEAILQIEYLNGSK